jgi:hypothetical protein
MPHVNELHEQHDPMLVVSLASGDLATADRDYATAQSLVAGRTDCARLHDDVLAIASATKALPPAARTRDFRISNEQAAKLRPAGVRGVLARLTAPGGLFSRQLGVGLATLGVAGLLIGSLGSINLGMAGAAPAPAASMAASAPEYVMQASPAAASGGSYSGFAAGAGAAASQRPEVDTAGSPPADAARRNVSNAGAGASSAPVASQLPLPAPVDEGAEQPLVATGPPDLTSTGGPSPLIIVSIALLVAGAVVLVARQVSRGGSAR